MKPRTQWITLLLVSAGLTAVYLLIRDTSAWAWIPFWLKACYAVIAVLAFAFFCYATLDGRWVEEEQRQHEEPLSRLGVAWQFVKKEVPLCALEAAIWLPAVIIGVCAYIERPRMGE